MDEMNELNEQDEFIELSIDELLEKYRIEYEEEMNRLYGAGGDGDNEQFTTVEKYSRQTTHTDRTDDDDDNR